MTGDPFFPLGHRVFGSRVWNDADYAKFVRGHSPLPEERPVPVRIRTLWQRVIGDPRFGWVPWAAACLAGGLAAAGRLRHRRETLVWLTILAMQILLWLFTTHLFGRFASVLWIPLVFVISATAAWLTTAPDSARDAAGLRVPIIRPRALRPGLRLPSVWNAVCLGGLLVYLTIGQGWLFREYRQRLYVQGHPLPVHGNTDLFSFGKVAGFGHLEFINGDGQQNPGLPGNAKLLLVNDVCTFYIDRPCDYRVVFSRDRFDRAVEDAGGSADRVLHWLHQQGYTHVWANFTYMGRQGDPHIEVRTRITPELFASLETAGLKRLHEVRLPGDAQVYGVLYEVPGR
jgi:hypothetical protein